MSHALSIILFLISVLYLSNIHTPAPFNPVAVLFQLPDETVVWVHLPL